MMTAVYMVCQDDDKDVVPMSVKNFSYKGMPHTYYFYPGRVIFVKEPFIIGMDLREFIRVDYPSDVELLVQNVMKSEQIRSKGKQLVKGGNFMEAYRLYEQAIDNSKDLKEKAALIISKAIVYFKLNLKQQYKKCIEVLKIDPKDQKEHYHKNQTRGN